MLLVLISVKGGLVTRNASTRRIRDVRHNESFVTKFVTKLRLELVSLSLSVSLSLVSVLLECILYRGKTATDL